MRRHPDTIAIFADYRRASNGGEENERPTGDVARIMDALRRSVRALRSANVRARRELGVGAAQLFVLRQLADAPGLSLSELADRTHTAPSSVSEVVSGLVRAGYVHKTHASGDRRRIVLDITGKGAAVVQGAERPVQEQLIAGLGKLSAGERAVLADLYDAWLGAAGLGDLPASMFFEHYAPPAVEQATARASVPGVGRTREAQQTTQAFSKPR